MTWSHFLLALAVMAIWGTNFVVIRWGLGEFPPLAFAGLRFFFSAVPALFFLRLAVLVRESLKYIHTQPQ